MKKPKVGLVNYRAMSAEAVEGDDNLIELSVSSDLPYLRSFGYEVLEHSEDAIDMTRLLNGAPVLTDHDHSSQVGVVEKAWLDGNKLRARVRFSKSVKGQEIENDIKDGIRRNVSVGYTVKKWDNPKTRAEIDGEPVYRAVRWEPMEVSIVSVPADHTVGVGRNFKVGKRVAEELPILIYDKDDNLVEAILPDGEKVTDPELLGQLVAKLESEVEDERVEDELVDEEKYETDEMEEKTVEDILAELQEEVTELAEMVETIAGELVTEEASDTATEATEEVTSEEDMTEEAETERLEVAEEEAAEEDEDETSRTIHISVQERNTMKNNLDKVQNANIKLTEREQKQYSLSRAILAAADGKRSGFEFEISDEIAKKTGRDSNGFWMPTSVRAYDISDAASAGALTFTQGGEFIDFLRNRAVVAGLGASVMTLNAKTALPRATSDLSAQWIAEDGAGATFNSQSFDQVVLSPKKLATYTGVTREALTVATYDVENIIRNNIYSAFTVAFDRAAIQGAGGNEPTGLLNMTGLVSGSNSGSALTWAGAVDLQRLVAEGNADMGNLGYLSTVAVKTKAMTTIKSGSTAEFIVDNNGRLGLYDIVHSNNVPNLAGGGVLIFGDWSSLMLAEFGAIEIVVDPYTSKHKGIVEVGATMLGDIQVKQLRSFAIQKGLV